MEKSVKEIQVKNYLRGEIAIPGDKSVSHRSVMFAGLAKDEVKVYNFLPAADCMSTVGVMRSLGTEIEFLEDGSLKIKGNGLQGLKESVTVLDAGNSGTTLRLMMGILAGQNFLSTFTGDSSLSRRPMGRVITPLSRMGAKLVGRDHNKFLPITVLPHEDKLQAIEYEMPMASAQVKSSVLLAGLFAEGETTVIELHKSRDHTEKMLSSFGVPIVVDGNKVTLTPVKELKAPKEIYVPGDISSAAFWMVAAAVIPGSKLLIKNVGLNETRTGIIDVLKAMGAKLSVSNVKTDVEPRGDIQVEYSELQGIEIGGEIIPRIIDEIPIIAVAAMFAKGKTVITGAGELRVKETDRLAAVYEEFSKISPQLTVLEDGLIIEGIKEDTKFEYAVCRSWGDHRIAMSLAVLGTAAAGVSIEDADCVQISYPDFFEILDKL